MNKTTLTGLTALIAVGFGISSAYAITVTLAGDVAITEDLDVTGAITGPTINAINTAIDGAAICPQQNVEHWDKIIYFPTLLVPDIGFNTTPQGQPDLIEDRWFDIKVTDDPHNNVDLSKTVADRLNQLGYNKLTLNQPAIEPIHPDNIVIVDVEHSIICAELPPT